MVSRLGVRSVVCSAKLDGVKLDGAKYFTVSANRHTVVEHGAIMCML